MKAGLVKYGPLATAFMVHDSFTSYDQGVYHGIPGHDRVLGGHAITIVGYGVTNDEKRQKFWIVRNSWGTFF